MKNVFLTKYNKFLEFCQTSILTVGYLGFQKKKRFCDELILNTKVQVNVHPLSTPTRILITANFRDIRTLVDVLKNWKNEKTTTL